MYAFPKSLAIVNDFGSALSKALSLSSQTSVTTGASNVKGSWVALETSTDYAAYGFYVGVWGVATSASSRRLAFDIGIGGSGSETVLLPDFLVSTDVLTGINPGGGLHYFPLYIPSGVRVSIRAQGSTAVTVKAMIMFNYGGGITPIFQRCVALGMNTSSATQAVSVTPSSGAYGGYTTIATTSQTFHALLPSIGINSVSAPSTFVSLAIGVGSSDIFRRGFVSSVTESIGSTNNILPYYAHIASGTTLQARLWASDATPSFVSLYGFN
jgi:hypothetical protein